MDSFVNEEDFALLRQDYYTFEVLARILKGECELIRSNHENLLICHSESHYPVWIWTPDNVADEVKKPHGNCSAIFVLSAAGAGIT